MQPHSQISEAGHHRRQRAESTVQEAVSVRIPTSPSGDPLFQRRFSTPLHGVLSLGVPVLILIASLSSALAAMPHLDEVVSTKSAFTDDPRFGKDPFFPKSKRRVAVEVVARISATPDASAFNQVIGSVVLKGISGVAGRRLALLNTKTLATGEEADFKVNNQLVKIKCVEVREKSVVIGLEGSTETKEIHLRSRM